MPNIKCPHWNQMNIQLNLRIMVIIIIIAYSMTVPVPELYASYVTTLFILLSLWGSYHYYLHLGFPCSSDGKESTCNMDTWVWSLGWEDPLEEGMATHSSILAWRTPKDRGAWWAIINGVVKRQTRPSDSAQHTPFLSYR